MAGGLIDLYLFAFVDVTRHSHDNNAAILVQGGGT
jgi:hypothetical protein